MKIKTRSDVHGCECSSRLNIDFESVGLIDGVSAKANSKFQLGPQGYASGADEAVPYLNDVTYRIPLAACARTVARYFRGRSPGERVQPAPRIPAPEQLPHEREKTIWVVTESTAL